MSDTQTIAPVTLQRKAWAVVRLMRPVNLLMFFAGVALGGWLTAGTAAFRGSASFRLGVAALSAALLGAAANAINDYFDLEIDRVNRPSRPLPSGLLPRSAAWMIWLICSLLGLALSFLLSAAHVAIALLTMALTYAYSARIKHWMLAGNVLVAFVTPLALIVYGGWAVGPPQQALVAAVFAFLTTLGREITKDIEDVEGDAAGHSRTLPLVMGTRFAARTAAAILVLTIGLTPLPYVLLGYGGLYLLLVLLTGGILLRALWLLVVAPNAPCATEASQALKWAMLLGIVALATGRVLS